MVNSYMIKQCKVPFWLLFSLIFANSLWNLSWFNLKFYQFFHLIIMTFFIWNILNYKKRLLEHAYSKQYVILLLVLPLLSVYSCKILHDQSVAASLILWRMHFGWLLYFVLWKKKITEQQIIKAIFYIAIGYTMISIIQQITYPIAPFGSRTVGSGYTEILFDGTVEKRMGLYRFGISGVEYAIATFFIIVTYKHNIIHKNYNLILLLLIISIMATGSRQTMASVFAAYCYYLIYKNNVKYKIGYVILISCIIVFLYGFRETLFGSLSNVSEDLESGRSFSYIYYFNDYISSNLSIICGNGVGHESSAYGSEDIYFNDNRVILADIGMLGTLYNWGVIYVFIYFIAIIRFLRNNYLDTYLKAIMLAPILISWIGTPLWEFKGMIYQALLFYYCDINIKNNKLKNINIK